MTEPQEEEADYVVDTASEDESDDPFGMFSNDAQVDSVVNNDPAFKEVTEGVTWACSNRQLI